jgi:hypothetical protein
MRPDVVEADIELRALRRNDVDRRIADTIGKIRIGALKWVVPLSSSCPERETMRAMIGRALARCGWRHGLLADDANASAERARRPILIMS